MSIRGRHRRFTALGLFVVWVCHLLLPLAAAAADPSMFTTRGHFANLPRYVKERGWFAGVGAWLADDCRKTTADVSQGTAALRRYVTAIRARLASLRRRPKTEILAELDRVDLGARAQEYIDALEPASLMEITGAKLEDPLAIEQHRMRFKKQLVARLAGAREELGAMSDRELAELLEKLESQLPRDASAPAGTDGPGTARSELVSRYLPPLERVRFRYLLPAQQSEVIALLERLHQQVTLPLPTRVAQETVRGGAAGALIGPSMYLLLPLLMLVTPDGAGVESAIAYFQAGWISLAVVTAGSSTFGALKGLKDTVLGSSGRIEAVQRQIVAIFDRNGV